MVSVLFEEVKLLSYGTLAAVRLLTVVRAPVLRLTLTPGYASPFLSRNTSHTNALKGPAGGICHDFVI